MAYLKDFMLPPTGEQVDAARLVAWAVQPGESFTQGQTLFEIETDKSVIEIPAGEDGTMVEHLVQVDGVLHADTAVARIRAEGTAPEDEAASSAPSAPAPESMPARGTPHAGAAAPADKPEAAVPGEDAASRQGGAPAQDRTLATPSARRLARESGVPLASLAGTGPGGRITQGDVASALGAHRPAASGDAAQERARPAAAPRQAAYSVLTAHGGLFVGRWEPAAPRDAATVVLIHGMFGDMDTWAGTISALTRAGLRVLALDLPCHGKSASDAASMHDIVDAAAEVAARETSGPLALVGHSFGAAVAVRLAGKLGLRLHALALIAPMGLGTEIQQAFLDGMVHAATAEALERELRKLTETGPGLSAAYLRDLGERLRRRQSALDALCSALSRGGVQQIDTTAGLRALDCRTMVVHGRRDAIIPWRHALNAPPRAALHLLPGVGHMPQWEAATLTSELILDLVVR